MTPGKLDPWKAVCFPIRPKMSINVFQTVFQGTLGPRSNFNNPGEDVPKVPPHDSTYIPVSSWGLAHPSGPDVTAGCRWGRGRRGGSCAGIYILGTRRWDLQVPVARLLAPAREDASATASLDTDLARGPEPFPDVMPALPPPLWSGRHPGASCSGPRAKAWIIRGPGAEFPTHPRYPARRCSWAMPGTTVQMPSEGTRPWGVHEPTLCFHN
ncbi:uncharacterized protein LOC119541633 [Choloepus didactylus]|uniref:uncharacterized protein LOC119541633 n=1 Tax=Choloepus didactylus TaxID=27675 RepID=UPI00189EB570|nr:uncharacterized protein LOC119541633 [Choloepus didactylus]